MKAQEYFQGNLGAWCTHPLKGQSVLHYYYESSKLVCRNILQFECRHAACMLTQTSWNQGVSNFHNTVFAIYIAICIPVKVKGAQVASLSPTAPV
uniref:Uncharacterized protein n=1 Tax=Anguilla anguilla TaxID=7936 RepID=A0A0E9W9K3_ANGAN